VGSGVGFQLRFSILLALVCCFRLPFASNEEEAEGNENEYEYWDRDSDADFGSRGELVR
jgi:hypothetical protein